MTITVLMPIEVSDSNYCWSYPENILCPNFKYGDCKYNFKPIFNDNGASYLKPQECKNLLWKENVK